MGTQKRDKTTSASLRSRQPTRRLAAGTGKFIGQPAASTKPGKGVATHKFFNGFYAFLVITGMIVSALGLRTRLRQATVAPAGQVRSEEAVIFWTRAGDRLEKCQEVQIWLDGRVSTGVCGPSQADQQDRFQLDTAEIGQLRVWVEQFQPFSVDSSLPNTQSNDRIHLVFRGKGSLTATVLDEQAIENYVENLIQTGG